MRKIALITLYQENFGSVLQCFASKSYIQSLDCKCDLLFSKSNQISSIRGKIKKIILFLPKVFLYPSFLFFLFKIRKNKKKTIGLRSVEKINAFINKEIFPIGLIDSVLKSKEFLSQYSFFITGSDQVWNSSYIVKSFNFLQFAPRQKRIALATSFGTSEIPKYNQKALRKALGGFDYISVREETGVEIVKNYSKARICRVADPTLIYNEDEWKNFAKEVKVLQKKYIFVHFLNEPNQIAIEAVNWLSEQLNLNVVSIGYNYETLKSVKRFIYIDGGPWEYVSYIGNAEYVLTDSFHSTLFSINFNKLFFTFHRQYSLSTQTSRITDLLKRFDMGNRLIENVETLKQIYLENLPKASRKILEKERIVIRDYIRKSIFGQIPQCFLEGESNG